MKWPRLSRHLLYRPRIQGGLGVPNITYYYKAAQIAFLVQLYVGKATHLWTLIDLVDADPVPLSPIPWLLPQLCPKPLNVVLPHTLMVWNLAHLILPHLPLLEIFKCPLFPPGFESPPSYHWSCNKGLMMVQFLLSTRGVHLPISQRHARHPWFWDVLLPPNLPPAGIPDMKPWLVKDNDSIWNQMSDGPHNPRSHFLHPKKFLFAYSIFLHQLGERL